MDHQGNPHILFKGKPNHCTYTDSNISLVNTWWLKAARESRKIVVGYVPAKFPMFWEKERLDIGEWWTVPSPLCVFPLEWEKQTGLWNSFMFQDSGSDVSRWWLWDPGGDETKINLILLHVDIQLSLHNLSKRLFFPHWISCYACQNSTDLQVQIYFRF